MFLGPLLKLPRATNVNQTHLIPPRGFLVLQKSMSSKELVACDVRL